MAESEEELKSLLIKVKEESEKVVLKPNIQKTKIITSSLITSWQIDGETIVTDFTFLCLQNGLVGSPCSPRDSQESSPTPKFQSINSLVLSFLYSPTLTFMHDHWKKHSFD